MVLAIGLGTKRTSFASFPAKFLGDYLAEGVEDTEIVAYTRPALTYIKPPQSHRQHISVEIASLVLAGESSSSSAHYGLLVGLLCRKTVVLAVVYLRFHINI